MNPALAANDVVLCGHIEQTFKIAGDLHGQGKPVEAAQLYQFILAMMPEHYGALYRLGSLRARAAQYDVAMHLLRRAISANVNGAEAHAGLGAVLATCGRHGEAVACFDRALSIDPGHAGVINARGLSLLALGRTEQAIGCFEQAIAIKPDYVEAHFAFANLIQAFDRIPEAIEHYQKILAIDPCHAPAHNNLGNLLLRQRHVDAAIAHYRAALAINPSYVDGYCNLGNAYLVQNRNEEAIATNAAALRLQPNRFGAYNNMGIALQALGRIKEAGQAYQNALKLSPRETSVHLNLSSLWRFKPGDLRLAAMEKLAVELSMLDQTSQIELHFGLAKAYSDLDQHERAFTHLRQGNALKRSQITYDEKQTLGLFDMISRVFTPEWLRQNSGGGDDSALPVFVVGMPRSGTSLVEQILASHSQVFGAGEIEELGNALLSVCQRTGSAEPYPQIVKTLSPQDLRAIGSDYVGRVRLVAPTKQRIVNKLPLNFIFPGLIHLVLPNAKIIHIRRDPRDTCFSCFSQLFIGNQPFAFDLGELGRYYRGYAALMDHWRNVLPPGVMLELQYEDLVDDLETYGRALIAHCGLEWEAACLAFHTTKRSVQTASSVQVRSPLYRTSVGKWRAYKHFLQPLLEALEPIA